MSGSFHKRVDLPTQCAEGPPPSFGEGPRGGPRTVRHQPGSLRGNTAYAIPILRGHCLKFWGPNVRLIGWKADYRRISNHTEGGSNSTPHRSATASMILSPKP